jgi:hypothetical protein
VHNGNNMPPLNLPQDKDKTILRDHGDNKLIMHGRAGNQWMSLVSPRAVNLVAMRAPAKPLSADVVLQDNLGNQVGFDPSQDTAAFGELEFVYNELANQLNQSTVSGAQPPKKGKDVPDDADQGQSTAFQFDINSLSEGAINSLSLGNSNSWVGHDSNAWVKRNDNSTVMGDSNSTIQGNQNSTVIGDSYQEVDGDATSLYTGSDVTNTVYHTQHDNVDTHNETTTMHNELTGWHNELTELHIEAQALHLDLHLGFHVEFHTGVHIDSNLFAYIRTVNLLVESPSAFVIA